MEKPAFYKKLTTWGKKHYDVQEARKPHTERFIKLMNQDTPSKNADPEGLFYSTEERDYLGKEDLVTLGELHSSEAEYYMLDS